MTTLQEAAEYGRFCWEMMRAAEKSQDQIGIDYWGNEWRTINENIKAGIYE